MNPRTINLFALVCLIAGMNPAWSADKTADASGLYARYSQGVALMKEGGEAQGVAVLQEIGQSELTDATSMALSDQANLMLGYHFLHNQQGKSAIDALSRVRSPGPYGNRALLAYGWAFLVSPGSDEKEADEKKSQNRVTKESTPAGAARLENPAENIGGRPQHLVLQQLSGKEREEALRCALVPWVELIGRDPLDPAVQEGMVSIAFALNQMGAHAQAQQYYLRAIRELELTHNRLNDALDQVSGGRMIEILSSGGSEADKHWPWWFADLPKGGWWRYGPPDAPAPAPETFYLEHLFSDINFIEALQAYDSPRALEDASEAAHKRLEMIAMAELQREKLQTESYLVEARFELARIYDPPPAGAVE